MTINNAKAATQARPARPTTKSVCPEGAGIIDNAPAHETAHTPPQACAAPPSCATAQQSQESPHAQLAEGYEHNKNKPHTEADLTRRLWQLISQLHNSAYDAGFQRCALLDNTDATQCAKSAQASLMQVLFDLLDTYANPPPAPEQKGPTALEHELAKSKLLIRELDLLFGQTLLVMRAAVIEEEHGKGAEAAMTWISNSLVGPGELPPEEDTDAQAYFDREYQAISDGLMRISDERAALSPAPVQQQAQAAIDILAERRRQIDAEGWTQEHDDKNGGRLLGLAAACYALSGSCASDDETAALLVDLAWPWPAEWWKPTTPRRDLVKAGALILAEIERLDRQAEQEKDHE